MSKWDKLLTRICALSKDLRFDGFMLRYRNRLTSGFSERVMTAPSLWGIHYISIAFQYLTQFIKKVYVEMVKQIVESEAVNDENAE